MLTEKEAWYYLADLWNTAALAGKHMVMLDYENYGLCGCVASIRDRRQTTLATYLSMKAKLDKERGDRNLYDYFWPWTPEGAATRAKFCKTQGDLC